MPKAKYILPTITPAEAVRRLQELGVRTSVGKIRAGIMQGVYPFGVCIEMGQYEFEIYEKLFDDWVKERLIEQSAASQEGPGNELKEALN